MVDVCPQMKFDPGHQDIKPHFYLDLPMYIEIHIDKNISQYIYIQFCQILLK